MGQVDQLVVGIEQPVLEHRGKFIVASRQIDLRLHTIINDEKAGQAGVDLQARLFVGMGVVPVGAGPVADLEFIGIAPAGSGF